MNESLEMQKPRSWNQSYDDGHDLNILKSKYHEKVKIFEEIMIRDRIVKPLLRQSFEIRKQNFTKES